LGFDTEMSTDHDWGPRVDVFLMNADVEAHRLTLETALRNELPPEHRGYTTSFSDPDPNDNGTRLPEHRERGAIRHKIGIMSPTRFVRDYLAYEVADTIPAADWLTFPEQKLRTIAHGPIFHDDLGLGDLRARFAYYPHDVWLYLLAAAWTRIGQEEHLMGRAGFVGDEIGSAIIGARLVRDLMRLSFLMERTYAPYPKWFGTAFQRLRCAEALTPHLRAALASIDWRERESHLVRAYEIVAAMHNALEVTDPLPTSVRPFFGRPFQVIEQHGFANAIAARIEDPVVQKIASHPRIGSVDQISDNTDVVSGEQWRGVLRTFYSGEESS
jgi:hypothetical protein